MVEKSDAAPAPSFANKVIAFVDIVGFSNMVERATDHDLPGLLELVARLGKPLDAVDYHRYGPIACPNAKYLDKALDFKITQVSDCVIVSAELSPAGVINVIHYCSNIALKMMEHRQLVRGSIVIGPIFHHGISIIGEGYQRAVKGEGRVSLMSDPLKTESAGGPFIEIGPDVLRYIADQPDKCVKHMLLMMTETDGTVTAIYPYNSVAESHSCEVKEDFDPHYWRASVSEWRGSWMEMREFLSSMARSLPPKPAAKWQHAAKGVDHIISRADDRIRQLDNFIARGRNPPLGTVWGTL